MQGRIIDDAITVLNAIYWTVMALWFAVLVTDNDILTAWGSAGFAGTALVAVCGWHLLRYKRKKLQANQDTDVEGGDWPGGG